MKRRQEQTGQQRSFMRAFDVPESVPRLKFEVEESVTFDILPFT